MSMTPTGLWIYCRIKNRMHIEISNCACAPKTDCAVCRKSDPRRILTPFLASPGKIVARASSPAGSGGVSPRESNLAMRPRSETLLELAAGDGCATRTVSRCASDPEKVKIALRLRWESIMTLKWIAQRLQMGSWTNVSNCLATKSK